MILLSNHLSRLFPPPEGAVIRVNLAWYGDRGAAEADVIAHNTKHDVYLDFPQGRSKPPVPVLTLEDAIAIANGYDCVKYFAVSNVERTSDIADIRAKLTRTIEIVPKIETKKGVLNLDLIVMETGIKYAMLDKEDLYSSVKRDSAAFNILVNIARAKAGALGIELLELQGVVFA